MKMLYVAAVFTLALAGCQTPKTFVATNGSRADGTVELAYEHDEFEVPVVDNQETYTTAKKRCVAWGYKDTEPFGGQTTGCNGSDCSVTVVTTRYQCLGNPK